MDRFPKYPPPDDHVTASDMEIVEFSAWIGLGLTVWILALLAVGYWIAGAAPFFGAYIHGVLLGMLLGIALILSVLTPRKPRQTAGHKETSQ
jgi:hypothetical protein